MPYNVPGEPVRKDSLRPTPAVSGPDGLAVGPGNSRADHREAAWFDEATSQLEAPLAVIDMEAFKHNAAELLRRAAGKPVRIATKSIRCRELIRRALAVPGCAGLMCYSLPEALWLYREGLSDDILVAYPTADRAALRELAADHGAANAIAVTIDSAEHLDFIDRAVGNHKAADGLPGTTHPIRVCLEVDASWRPLAALPWLGRAIGDAVHVGTRRSPVHAPAQVRRLANTVIDRSGYRLVGLMLYEGQIAGVGDAKRSSPVRDRLVRWMQQRSAAELAKRRAQAVAAVQELTALEFVNGGGTGSLETTATEEVITEVAAGSGLIGPTLFDAYSAFCPQPAALFALPVVHRPRKDIATLFGGGYIASGPVALDRLPVPHLPAGLRLTATEGAGEVQTPVAGQAARSLRLGDRVWLRHAKAGELAERFERYHLLESRDGSGAVVTTVPTYRGEGRSFG